MAEMKITVYPMKCPICKLYKEFISDEAREKYMRPHCLKCFELNKRLHSGQEDDTVVDELFEHIKKGDQLAEGEVPKELTG